MALAQGFDGATITITATETITLTGELPNVTGTMTIIGPGAGSLSITSEEGMTETLFNVSGKLTVSGLTFGGLVSSDDGGVFYVSGELIATDCVFGGNTGVDGGNADSIVADGPCSPNERAAVGHEAEAGAQGTARSRPAC